MQPSKGSGWRLSWYLLVIGLLVLLGYVFIISSVIFPANANETLINRLSENVHAAQLMLEAKEAEIVTFQKHLRERLPSHGIQDIADVESNVKYIALMAENNRLKGEINALDSKVSAASTTVAAPVVTTKSISDIDEPFIPIEGVIVLGMHRSGTSVVGGLLNKMGLNAGGPLIGAAEDNAKGFFERIDVVLQNDYLMKNQNIAYSSNTHSYDHMIGLADAMRQLDPAHDPSKFFAEGRRALKFLNDPGSYPWMLKDPRLCITLRTWLPLLNFNPAILFIFRHPLDVALSLHHREGFRIGKGLRMWYVYNRRALQQSGDLCRVVGSQREVMANSRVELDRIYDELRDRCHVPVPHKIAQADLTTFIDPKLQHGRTSKGPDNCELLKQDLTNLHTITPPEKSWVPENEQMMELYRESIRVFCAMEDKSAFGPAFKWEERITDA